MKHISRLSLHCLLAIFSLTLTSSAIAGCWLEYQGINTKLVCGPTDGPGVSYSTVQIKNNCRYPIWVATTYYGMTCPDYPGNHSCLSEYIPPSQRWQIRGWWSLNRGQVKYIADTIARNTYFYAETKASAAKSLEWRGTDFESTINGETVKFFKADMGSKMTNYTQSFSCPNVRSGDYSSENPVSSSEDNPQGPSEQPGHTDNGAQDNSGDDWDGSGGGDDDWD